MDIKLRTEGAFESAHYLRDYDGKCANVHGHNYKVIIKVRGDRRLRVNGILWDFGNLKDIINKYDHTILNDWYEFRDVNPTAENIAMVIWKSLKNKHPQLRFLVRIYETPKCYAETGDY